MVNEVRSGSVDKILIIFRHYLDALGYRISIVIVCVLLCFDTYRMDVFIIPHINEYSAVVAKCLYQPLLI